MKHALTARSSTLPLTLAVTGFLVGCQAAPPASGSVAIANEADSVLGYLLAKYDANGDGSVVAAEYDRDADRFARLDRDSNGRIDAADFESEEEDGERMSGMRAQLVVASYFQGDDNPELLHRAELTGSITSYDEDGNGQLTAAEFEASAAERANALEDIPPMMRRMLGDSGPWSHLVRAIDSDADSELSQAELLAFFDGRDSDSNGVWELGMPEPPGINGTREPESGPRVGSVAPDFELPLLHDESGRKVRLSSFRNEKPVALIFGSYT